MAKKEDLKTDPPMLDDDLNFDFDDLEFDGSMSQKSKSKTRSAVSQVATGVGEGVKGVLTDPSVYQKILRKSLPSTYGDIADGVSELTQGTYELYDQTVKELKPRIGRVASKLEQLTPENQAFVKKMLGKVASATGEKGSTSSVAENMEEQGIQNTLAEVFQAQVAQSKVDETRRIFRDRIDQKRHNESVGLSVKMQRDLSILRQYTTNVTQPYQRKSLELQLRTYLGQREYFTRSLALFETFKAQNEAIVKNTSLPEYAKITESERFKNQAKERFISSLYGEGSIINRGMKKLKKTAGEMLEGVSMRLDMTEMGLDMALSQKEMIEQMNQTLAEMGEEPLSKGQMLGMMATNVGMEFLQDKVVDKLKKKVNANSEVKEKLAMFSKYFTNPTGMLAKYRNSDQYKERMNDETPKGRFYKALDFVLEHFNDETPSRSFSRSGMDELHNPTMGFDKQAHVSLVSVIPGHLANIHREIVMMRTGRDDAPLMTYDYERNEFVNNKKMANRIMSDFREQASRSLFNSEIKGLEAKVTGKRELPEESRVAIRIFLSRLTREGDIDYNWETIKETDAYKSMPKEIKPIIRAYFKRFESATTGQQTSAAFTKSIRSAKDAAPSMDATFSKYIRAGYGDLLRDKGLVRKEGSSFDVDEDRYYDMLESSAFGRIRSDVNVKKNIKPTSSSKLLQSLELKAKKFLPKKAYESFKKTKLYDWMYKPGIGDNQPHAGPMAQDVNKNFGNEAAPDGTSIDLQTMNGAFFSAVQHIGDKVDELKGPNSQTSADYLQRIAESNEAILDKLSKGALLSPGRGRGRRGNVKPSGPMTLGELLDATIETTTEGIKSGAKSIKDNIFTPAKDKIKEFYDKNKDPAKDNLVRLFDSAVSMGRTAMDKASSFIQNTVPASLKNAKEFLKNIWSKINLELETLRDLYLPNGTEPVIRAVKVKAGEYLDEVTGKPLLTMEQILQCKNNIVDKSGNIILSAQDKVQGLYDRYGEKIKTNFQLIGTVALGVGKYALDKAKDFLKFAKEGGLKSIDSVKKFFKENSFGEKFSFGGMGFYNKQLYEAVVDIRDIMLGDIRNVRKRLSKKKKTEGGISIKASDATGASSTLISAVGEAAQKETTSPLAVDTTEAYGPQQQGSGGFGITSLLNKGRDLYNRREELMEDGKNQFSKLKEKAQGANDRIQNSSWWQKGKDKLGGLTGGLGEKFGKLKNSRLGGFATKATGMLGGKLGGIASFATGALSSMFGGSSEESQQNGVDWSAPKGKISGLNQDDYSSVKASKKPVIAEKDRAWNDKDGSGSRDGGIEERSSKIEDLKKARTKKTLEADTEKRYGGGISNMLKSAGELFSAMKSGLGTMFSTAADFLSNIPGIGKIASVAKNFLGKGGLLRTLGQVGWQLGGTALRTGLFVGGEALAASASLATSAAVSLGGTLLTAVTSSVVIVPAMIGLGAYGLYKLYKHAHRNDANDYERVRLRQYGFAYNTAVERYNSNIYLLEEYLQDSRIGYNGDQPYIIDKKIDKKELLGCFNISPDDTEQVDMFAAWFKDRFKPFFLNHISALYRVDPKANLRDVHKLSATQRLQYLEQTKNPDGPYNYDISPLKDKVEINVNREEILEQYDNLTTKVRLEVEKTKKDTPKIPKPQDSLEKSKDAPEKDVKTANDEVKQKVRQAELAQQSRRRAAAQAALGAKTEGDGKTPGATSAPGKAAGMVGSIPMAGGAVLEGADGLQYVTLRKDAKLEGASPAMVKLFLGMAEEYGKMTGKTIPVNDGFRTYEEQSALHKRYPDKAAPPGRSLHEFGLAIDIDSKVADELEKLGLMKKYGFTRPVGGEPWHIEPAMVQKSIDLARKNGDQRESMVEASIGRGGGGYGTVSNAVKYRRNHELAMSLIDARGSTIQTALNKDYSKELDKPAFSLADQSNSAGESKPSSLPQAPSPTQQSITAAANDAGKTQSKTNDLPDTSRTAFYLNQDSEEESTGSQTKATASAPEDIQKIVEESAKRTGVDPSMLSAFVAVESSFNPNAKSKSSSASGLLQFVSNTWNESLGKYGRKYNLGPNTSPFDPEAASLMGGEYLKANMKIISSVKPSPNVVDAYLAHFLGAGGARRFLSSDPSAVGASVFPEAAARNREIFFDKGRALTIGEIYRGMAEKIKNKAQSFGLRVNVGGPGLKPPSKGDTGEPGLKLGDGQGVEAFNQPVTSDTPPANINYTGSATGMTKADVDNAQPRLGRGINFDTRNPVSSGTSSVGTGQQPGAINTARLEAIFEKAIDLNQEQLTVLKSIDSSLKPEALLQVMAAAAAALPKPEKAEEKSVKEKDRINMGRTTQASGPSLDMARRTA